MPDFRQNNLAGMVFYNENPFGTPGANGHKLAVAERGFGLKRPMGSTRRRPTSFNPVRSPHGIWQADGNIGFIAEEDTIGMVMHKIFGAATVTGAGAVKTHTWKINDDDPGSVTIEELDGFSQTKADVSNGVKFTGFEVNYTKEANDAVITVDALGLGTGVFDDDVIDGTPTDYVGYVYNLASVSTKINGSASLLVLRTRIRATRYSSNPPVHNSLYWGSYVLVGGWKIEVEVEGLWTQGVDDLRAPVVAATEFSVETILTLEEDATHTFSVLCPEVRGHLDDVPAWGQSEGERQITLRGEAFYEDSAQASAIVVTQAHTTVDFGAAWAA